MAYLAQTCSAPDSPYFTFSGWFRCPTAEIPGGDNCPSLITIAGVIPGSSDPRATYILLNAPFIYTDETFTTTMQNTVQAGLCTPDPEGSTGEVFFVGRFTSVSNAVTGETWTHVFVSSDMSASDGDTGTTKISSTKLRNIYVNGINKLFTQTDEAHYLGAQSFQDTPFNVAFSGLEFGFPAGPGYYVEFQPKLEYANVQIWLGTYIDPAYIDKFISEEGGPVDPSIAAATFGAPTFSFLGGQSTFRMNAGSGGSVTDVGTITDFTPGP